MADVHEIYPSAPLALVAVEVRFPQAPAETPLPASVQRSFRDILGDDWVMEQQKVQQAEVSFAPGAPAVQTVRETVVPRFTVRDRTWAVALAEASLTVETTAYRHYPAFRAVLERAFQAAGQLLQPDGISRVGMRYIDEVRVPGMDADDLAAWRDWLPASLFPPAIDDGPAGRLDPAAWQGTVRYATGPERSLVLRYLTHQGYAVEPRGTLSRPALPPPGPLFVLDFDSFWEPSDIPVFDPVDLLRECDALRAPVRAAFDSVVSDRLRDEVFRRGPIHG